MNLYALTLSIPKELIGALSAQGRTFLDKLPSRPDRVAALALVGIRNKTDLANVSAIRKRLPKARLVFIVPDHWLTDEVHTRALMKFHENCDVCQLSQWPLRFWFFLQTAIEHYGLLQKVNDLERHLAEITERTSRLVTVLENNLQLAENVQRSLLPQYTPDIPGVSISVKYLPAQGIGGDYYDIFEFGDRKRFGFLLADSKSHGLAAALLSVLIKIRLEEMKERFPDTQTFVDFLNQELYRSEKRDLSTLNILYGILDRATLEFEFTTAGPLTPTLIRHGKVAPLLPATNPPIGEYDSHRYKGSRIALKPGDLLLLHTDGLSSIVPPKSLGELVNHVYEKATTPDGLSIQNEILGRIRSSQEEKPLSDDITLIHLSVVENVIYLASHSK